MQTKSNNNILAIIIGFILIFLIVIITILRPIFSKNNSEKNLAKQEKLAAEKIKEAQQISSEDLIKKIQHQENLILLDIRSNLAYDHEHILNSQNIPLSNIPEALGKMDRSTTFIIIDEGILSRLASEIISGLKNNGFEHILYLQGGFVAWKNNYNPTISSGDPKSFTDQSKVSYIQTDDLKTLLDTESNLILLDVRKSNQFNLGHLRGAINIFLDDLEKRQKDIPVGKKIIVYDNDGLGAFKAAVRLFDMGFFNTLALSDGFDIWQKKNYEIEN